MKKNLTFLMMLMAFVGIAFAQSGPKFNYSAVLRHHVNQYVTVDGDTLTHIDTLYHNNDVNITITVKSGETGATLYEETHAKTTDDNGFVSIVIGEGTPVSGTLEVDWNDTIIAKFVLPAANDTIMYSTIAVKPVPFALQAAEADLTTPLIAAYLENTLKVNDAKAILGDFVNNTNNLEEDVEDLIEDSLKTRRAMDSLKVVAKAYLTQITKNDLQQVYDILMGKPAAQKEAVKDYIKSIVEEPDNTLPVARKAVNELLAWYLNTYDLMPNIKEDVESVYHAAQEISAEDKAIIKDTVKGYLSEFTKSAAFIAIVTKNSAGIANVLSVVIDNITENDANAAFGWFDMKNSAVKDQMRDDILNDYIKGFTGTASALNTKLTNVVTATVNEAKTGNHLVKKCPDASHDYCH